MFGFFFILRLVYLPYFYGIKDSVTFYAFCARRRVIVFCLTKYTFPVKKLSEHRCFHTLIYVYFCVYFVVEKSATQSNEPCKYPYLVSTETIKYSKTDLIELQLDRFILILVGIRGVSSVHTNFVDTIFKRHSVLFRICFI